MVEYAGIGGFILLVLDVWAIVSILGARCGTAAKVFWTLLVLILPLVGFIVWLLVGPRAPKTGA